MPWSECTEWVRTVILYAYSLATPARTTCRFRTRSSLPADLFLFRELSSRPHSVRICMRWRVRSASGVFFWQTKQLEYPNVFTWGCWHSRVGRRLASDKQTFRAGIDQRLWKRQSISARKSHLTWRAHKAKNDFQKTNDRCLTDVLCASMQEQSRDGNNSK